MPLLTFVILKGKPLETKSSIQNGLHLVFYFNFRFGGLSRFKSHFGYELLKKC